MYILQWIRISANLKMILQLKVVCSPERILPYLSKMSSLLLLWIHPHNLSFKFVSILSDFFVTFHVPVHIRTIFCILLTVQIWKSPLKLFLNDGFFFENYEDEDANKDKRLMKLGLFAVLKMYSGRKHSFVGLWPRDKININSSQDKLNLQ